VPPPSFPLACLYLYLGRLGTHSAFAFCACVCVFDFFLAAFMSEAKNDTTPKSFFLCSVGKRSILTNYA
jgi:hypothetical protein